MDGELSNYVPINRKFFAHAFWKEKRPFSKSEAWLYLIVNARFEESTATELIGGKIVKWNRGELPGSLRYLSEAWGWSKNKVDDFLKMLESEGMIIKRTAEGTSQTIITLCNYVTYNGNKKKKGQQKGQTGDSEGTVKGQQGDKTNIDNIVKKEEDGRTPPCGSQSHPPVEYNEKQLASFKIFEDWIKENAPRVAQMKEPFTISEYLKIAQKYKNDVKAIKELLGDMHNWADLHKKRVNAYLTLLNWKRREDKK